MGHVEHPGRALVAHPVNPPALIPVVELCATPWTSPETMERVRAFMTGAGMEPVTVLKEIDGFILNRLQYTLVAEAMHPQNITTQIMDERSRWITVDPENLS